MLSVRTKIMRSDSHVNVTQVSLEMDTSAQVNIYFAEMVCSFNNLSKAK